MGDRAGELPSNLDIGALGHAVLDAAHVAHIGIAVALVDPPRPRCIYINQAAADIVGWPADELLNGDPLGHVAPEDMDRVQERFAKRSNGEKGERPYELTLLRQDGRRVTVAVTTSAATVGGRAAVFAFVVDVTARKEAERARLRSEAHFRHLMEIAPDPFGIICDSRFVFATLAYARVAGFATVEELYAVPVTDLVVPEEAELMRAREKFMVEGGRPPPTTYHVRRRDGAVMHLEVSSGPCEYEGKPAVLTIARDVSARKALEAQLIQADRLPPPPPPAGARGARGEHTP